MIKMSEKNARIFRRLGACALTVGLVGALLSLSSQDSSDATNEAKAAGLHELPIGDGMAIDTTTEPLLVPPIDQRSVGEVQTATFALG